MCFSPSAQNTDKKSVSRATKHTNVSRINDEELDIKLENNSITYTKFVFYNQSLSTLNNLAKLRPPSFTSLSLTS